MNISIVSLAWNKLNLTRDFLENLKKNTDFPFQLVFTDNGSEEPIVALVKEYFPGATIIANKKNIGCPATRNPAMEKVKCDYVFWLDNDTMVYEGWYKPFLNQINNNQKLGICGPFGKRVKNPFELPFPFEEPVRLGETCDGFMGYALCMRREAYQPIPDWGLAVNMDDIDVAVEMKAKGWQARALDLIPNLYHLGSQTARGWEADNQKVLKKWWKKWRPKRKEVFENYKHEN